MNSRLARDQVVLRRKENYFVAVSLLYFQVKSYNKTLTD